VSLYYQHSPEVVGMLKKDAALQEEVKGSIISALPLLSAMATGSPVKVTEPSGVPRLLHTVPTCCPVSAFRRCAY